MVAQRQDQLNLRIEQPRLLLVEGHDDFQFFRRLIERRRKVKDIQETDVQIIRFVEEGKLTAFLASVIAPRLGDSSVPVQSLGVVRDADTNYPAAFQSVQGALRHAGLAAPSTPSEREYGELPDTDVICVVTYIMPDNNSPGDLETLCLKAVHDAPAMPCVESYFECLQSIDHVPRQESKARLRAFLASHRRNPNLRIGEAVAAGVIPWNSPAFNGVHQFLDMLDAAN